MNIHGATRSPAALYGCPLEKTFNWSRAISGA